MTVDWNSINLSTQPGLTKLNEHLSSRSYISGYNPSQDDVLIHKKVAVLPQKTQFVHAARWFKHVSYFTDGQKGLWPKGLIPTKKEEEEIDLFGDDDGAAKKAVADKAKAAKESKKPAVIAKSTLVFEIKPANEKTNLDEIEKEVRKIAMDGLEWSPASKKIPIAYGLFKLQMGAVIVDDLVQTDTIVERIECIGLTAEEAAKRIAKRDEGDEDEDGEEDEEEDIGMVQSAEIVSFQKL